MTKLQHHSQQNKYKTLFFSTIMYQNVLTLVTTFSILKSGHQIATQLGYKTVHFNTSMNIKKARKLSIYTLWYIVVFEPGREEGIRTLDTVTRILPFQGSSFNHSDTSLNDGQQKY
jgi:hypothetical protein